MTVIVTARPSDIKTPLQERYEASQQMLSVLIREQELALQTLVVVRGLVTLESEMNKEYSYATEPFIEKSMSNSWYLWREMNALPDDQAVRYLERRVEQFVKAGVISPIKVTVGKDQHSLERRKDRWYRVSTTGSRT